MPQKDMDEKPSPLYFKIGGAEFYPLGFMDLTNVFRSPNIGSGIGTNFAQAPYRIPANFPGAGLTEDLHGDDVFTGHSFSKEGRPGA